MAGDSDRSLSVAGGRDCLSCERLSAIPVRPSGSADLAPVDDREERERTPRRNRNEDSETEDEPGDELHWRAPDEPMWRQYAQEMYEERLRQQQAAQNQRSEPDHFPAEHPEEVPDEHAHPEEVPDEHPDEPDVGIGVDPDLGQEARRPRNVPQPAQPTREELEMHRRTHLPFRAWCPDCVACALACPIAASSDVMLAIQASLSEHCDVTNASCF